MCWNRLDMSCIEPYLDENVKWSGGVPEREIFGKAEYLKLMAQVFDSLQYSKKSYRADVVMMNEYYACITIDGEYEDLAHRIKIEDGLIKEIWITAPIVDRAMEKVKIAHSNKGGITGISTG